MSNQLFFKDTGAKKKKFNVDTVRPIPPIPQTDWVRPSNYPDLSSAKIISVDLETCDPHLKVFGPSVRRDGYIAGIAIGTDDGFRAYYPIRHEVGGIMSPHNMPEKFVLKWLSRELSRKGQKKIGANLMYDLDYLTHAGVNVEGPFLDVLIAEPLIDENQHQYNLERISNKYLGEGKDDSLLHNWAARAYGGKPTRADQAKNYYRCPPELVGPYAISDIDLPLRIWEKQEHIIKQENLEEVFDIETRLVPVLLEMRQRGVGVDIARAMVLGDQWKQEERDLRRELGTYCGMGGLFNEGATDHLELLWKKQGLALHKTPKGNVSFNAAVIDACEDPVVNKVKRIRQLAKSTGTYIDGYFSNHTINGRIHCQFNQLRSDDGGTVSGRFSCVAPWTPINTKDGVKRIEHVQVGDNVWTHKERWREVTHTWLKGEEQMYDVRFCNGETLTCTKEHRVLLSTGKWETIGNIINGGIKKLDTRSDQHTQHERTLSNERFIYDKRNSKTVINYTPQRESRFKNAFITGRTKSFKSPSVFGFQNWGVEPNEGEDRRTTSQLHRGLRRRERLPHCKEKGKARVCASLGNGQRVRTGRTPPTFGCSPYRRKYKKQRIRQPSFMHTSRTQNYPLLTGKGQQILSIDEINAVGCFEVYDITVEDDESYLSCGVYSHNSSNPNLQNITSRGEFSVLRELFIPKEGFKWWKLDYSSIEPRLCAHYGMGPSADALRAMYEQDVKTDFYKVAGKAANVDRASAKEVALANMYGRGIPSMAAKLGISTDEAQRMTDMMNKANPFIPKLAEMASKRAKARGYITTLSGRRRRFNDWCPANWNIKKKYENKHGKGSSIRSTAQEILDEFECSAARDSTHKSLNSLLQGGSADLIKKAMVESYEAGVYSDIGVPLLTVHDELDLEADENNPTHVEAIMEVKRHMETAYELKVHPFVDIEMGPNWKKVADYDY